MRCFTYDDGKFEGTTPKTNTLRYGMYDESDRVEQIAEMIGNQDRLPSIR